MNRKQRAVLMAGIALVLLAGLFPPFHLVMKDVTSSLGFHLIFRPPKFATLSGTIDSTQLLLEWLLVIIVTCGLLLFFKEPPGFQSHLKAIPSPALKDSEPPPLAESEPKLSEHIQADSDEAGERETYADQIVVFVTNEASDSEHDTQPAPEGEDQAQSIKPQPPTINQKELQARKLFRRFMETAFVIIFIFLGVTGELLYESETIKDNARIFVYPSYQVWTPDAFFMYREFDRALSDPERVETATALLAERTPANYADVKKGGKYEGFTPLPALLEEPGNIMRGWQGSMLKSWFFRNPRWNADGSWNW